MYIKPEPDSSTGLIFDIGPPSSNVSEPDLSMFEEENLPEGFLEEFVAVAEETERRYNTRSRSHASSTNQIIQNPYKKKPIAAGGDSKVVTPVASRTKASASRLSSGPNVVTRSCAMASGVKRAHVVDNESSGAVAKRAKVEPVCVE